MGKYESDATQTSAEPTDPANQSVPDAGSGVDQAPNSLSSVDPDQSLKGWLREHNWSEVAEKLNSYSADDIQNQISSLGIDTVSVHKAALSNPKLGPQSQIALLTTPPNSNPESVDLVPASFAGPDGAPNLKFEVLERETKWPPVICPGFTLEGGMKSKLEGSVKQKHSPGITLTDEKIKAEVRTVVAGLTESVSASYNAHEHSIELAAKFGNSSVSLSQGEVGPACLTLKQECPIKMYEEETASGTVEVEGMLEVYLKICPNDTSFVLKKTEDAIDWIKMHPWETVALVAGGAAIAVILIPVAGAAAGAGAAATAAEAAGAAAGIGAGAGGLLAAPAF
jgi:hypothetical protein